jgi:hypothetical protein
VHTKSLRMFAGSATEPSAGTFEFNCPAG